MFFKFRYIIKRISKENSYVYTMLFFIKQIIFSLLYRYKTTDSCLKKTRDTHEPVVVFVGHCGRQGGAQKIFLNIVEFVSKKTKYDIRVILMSGGEWVSRFRRISTTVVFNGFNKKEILRQTEGADLFFINSIASGHFFDIYHPPDDIPVLTYVHELEGVCKELSHRFHLCRKKSTRILCASEAVYKFLNKYKNISRLEVFHNFIDPPLSNLNQLECVKEKHGIHPNTKVVMGCGIMNKRKSPISFLEVARRVIKRNSNVVFMWVGDGEDKKKCMSLARKYKISKNVLFVGRQNDIFSYLNSSDLFLLTSIEDPFPLACLEAAFLGVPVGCFKKNGGIPSFVGSECGFSCEFMNIDKMADMVHSLLGDSQTLWKMGQKAKTKVQRLYTLEKKGEELLGIIKKELRQID